MDSGRSISGRLRDDGTDWIVRQWAIETGNDRVWQPYGRVNLWRDWVAAVSVDGTAVSWHVVESAVDTPLEAGGRQQVVTNPPWLGVATKLVRSL